MTARDEFPWHDHGADQWRAMCARIDALTATTSAFSAVIDSTIEQWRLAELEIDRLAGYSPT